MSKQNMKIRKQARHLALLAILLSGTVASATDIPLPPSRPPEKPIHCFLAKTGWHCLFKDGSVINQTLQECPTGRDCAIREF
jgi:hypothetical protein